MEFTVDKASSEPVYRQIVSQITRLIQAGELAGGDRLPPERELAERLGTARGTVKKAYEVLAKEGVIEIFRGNGTYVAIDDEERTLGRKERASGVIAAALDELQGLNMSFREIRTLIQVMIMEREHKLQSLHIAAIDCNPEALSIYEKQILYLSHMKLHKFLLEEAMNILDPEKRFGEFDIILTTATHYQELCSRMPNLKGRFIKAAVSPSQQTIVDIAAIPHGEVVGVVSRSRRFFEIIRERLKTFQIDDKKISHMYEKEEQRLPDFLASHRHIIVPTDCSYLYASEPRAMLQEFRERGGRIIPFEYRIQRGSLMVIEDRIAELLKI